MKTLFLAWQDPVGRSWYPVGRLTYNGEIYQFVYTKGAEEAQQKSNFQPIASLKAFDGIYLSDELFPLFLNRIPSRSRADYQEFVECLNMPHDEDDPIAMLVRTGGRRATDSFEVFPCPEPDEQGHYHVHFFAHGLRHFPEASIERIRGLNVNERLLVMWDFQNAHDRHALMLRTSDSTERDRHPVGYCPRYLVGDFFKILTQNPDQFRVVVERVNPPPAPLQLRLLCSLTACWPAETDHPFSTAQYQPIPAGVARNGASS